MRKILYCIVALFFVSLDVMACTGGKIYTGADTSREFCLSDKDMNWWSAVQWCETQGYTLALPEIACVHTEGEKNYPFEFNTQCMNMRIKWPFSKGYWLNLIVSSGKAAWVNGNHDVFTSNLNSLSRAFCYISH